MKQICLPLLLLAVILSNTGCLASGSKNLAINADTAVEESASKTGLYSRDGSNIENESDNSQADIDDEYVDDDYKKWIDDDKQSEKSASKNNDKEEQVVVKPYVKISKKTYQQQTSKKYAKQNKNPYGGSPLSDQLAQVIKFNANSQTLDQKYQPQKPSAYEASTNQYGQQTPNKKQQNRVEVLVNLLFAKQFQQWNPRNNNSQFEFFNAAPGNDSVPADNAAFVVKQNDNKNYYSPQNHDDSAKWQNDKHSKNDDGYVLLYSVPFNKYIPQDDQTVGNLFAEGFVQTKTLYSISPTQTFLARMKSSCKIINADQHPFPSSLVNNAWDDPRLANCIGPELFDIPSGVYVYISMTNTGVWANYARGTGNDTTLSFIVKRRIGVRPRYDSIVDGAIEIDNRQGIINFYLNGYIVWTIYTIGFLPPDDGFNRIDTGRGSPSLVQPSLISVSFGTTKCTGESDPNNADSRQRLVATAGPNSNFYRPNETFYDPNAQRQNILWGQGAIQWLIKLIIVRAESVLGSVLYGAVLPQHYE